MRVAIVIYCLRGGGAERVSSYLANSLAAAGHGVAVMTELPPETDQYHLDPGIARAVFGSASGGGRLRKAQRLLGKALRLRRALRRAKPDIVVSFMTRSNNLTLLATAGTRHKVVICERNDPRSNNERTGDAWLRRRLYSRADLLIAQTDTMAQVMRERFDIERTAVIPNPSVVDQASVPSVPDESRPDYILAMGRLAPQKGFDVLIRAYARSRARRSLELVIAGQGGHKGWYESIAQEEGVADRVRFVGHVDAPYPLIRGCRLFVLSSRWEGFPNVLLEAMSFGRPVISSVLPSGAHAMIENGRNGLLVPVGDVGALSAAIDRLALDRDAAEAMAARAPAAVEPFRLPVVMRQWETVLRGVTEGSRA